MRLRLEDNSTKIKVIKSTDGSTRTLYNPETGEGVVIEGDGLGRGLFSRLKQRRKIRQDNKTERITARQEHKTGRQGKRQERKDTRLDKRTARQESGKIKVIGKRAVVQARQQEKIDSATAKQQAAKQPSFDGAESDNIDQEVFDNTNGGQYETQGQDETQDVEYDDVTDQEEQGAYDNQSDDGTLYDGGVPLNGWVDTVFNVGKNLLTKTKTGQAVQQIAVNQADYNRMKQENDSLKKELDDMKNQSLIYGGGGLVAGIAGGMLLSKVLNK
jgi:hypothetical protein